MKIIAPIVSFAAALGLAIGMSALVSAGPPSQKPPPRGKNITVTLPGTTVTAPPITVTVPEVTVTTPGTTVTTAQPPPPPAPTLTVFVPIPAPPAKIVPPGPRNFSPRPRCGVRPRPGPRWCPPSDRDRRLSRARRCILRPFPGPLWCGVRPKPPDSEKPNLPAVAGSLW